MTTSIRTLTPEDAVIQFGPIVFQNEFSVVRVKTVMNKTAGLQGYHTQVVLHAKDASGVEQLPRGYVVGENMLGHFF